MTNIVQDKDKVLGQFFTKEATVERLLDLLFEFKTLPKDIRILEPSFGTGNFISALRRRGFISIDGHEIDPSFTVTPEDFFKVSTRKKYDLIIGNPPFTKYNLQESYYYSGEYERAMCAPQDYLPRHVLRKGKERIESAFLLKSLHHLSRNDASIAFVLPVSFFIRNRNKVIKKALMKKFSTIVIYQNTETWFDYHIPCCFAFFTNLNQLENKIVLLYEKNTMHHVCIDLKKFNDDMIPEVFFKKEILNASRTEGP
ncbi:SAM-dependent methyltransferase, partial [Desulfosarcina sp.]|nr:SAM-dependent methyltransferase [Desulfosarcina sp.]